MNAKPNKTERDSIVTEFYKEVEKGNLDNVKAFMIDQKVDIKYLNENYTPYWLMAIAALSENEELVDYLIANGGNVKLADSSGETPLHWVAWQGNLKASQILVDRGADLNAYYQANGGLTPLVCASESGNLNLVKYLVSKGSDPLFTDSSSGSSPLRGAAYKGKFEVFQYLAGLQPANYNWQPAVVYGIIGNNLDIIKYVVDEKGANVKESVKFWGLPIQVAAQQKFTDGSKNLEILKYLVSKGARLKDINDGNVFPWAMNECSQEVISYLIESGFEPTIGDLPRDWEPLPAALDKGNLAYAQYLVDNDSNKDLYFRRSSLIVFFINTPYVVDFLIKNGINKEYYSQAFLEAIRNQNEASADLLLKAGADINFKDSKGRNALYYIGSQSMGKYLINNGIDIGNKDVIVSAPSNFVLLQLFDVLNIEVPLTDSIINNGLLKSAQLGDAEMVKYFLKKNADVNYIATEKPVDLYEYFERDEFSVIGKTPLGLNAFYGYSKCSYACRYDEKCFVDAEIAKLLIDAGANVNYQDSTGNAALHYTSMPQYCRASIAPIPMGTRMDREAGFHGDPVTPPLQSHDLIMQELIKAKAKVNLQNNDGDTPLLVAAKSGNSDAIKLLLKARAAIDIKNKEGKVFLDYINDFATLTVLKNSGLLAKVDRNKLNQILINTYDENRRYDGSLSDKLGLLIDYGADVDSRFDNYDSTTISMKVVKDYSVNVRMLEFLIKKGADVNVVDNGGNSVLMCVLNNYDNKNIENLSETLQLLIKAGADVNKTNNNNVLPYTIANVKGKHKLLQILIDAGAKRDLENEWWYAISELRGEDCLRYLRKLIDEGIDVNSKTTCLIKPQSSYGFKKIGMTALMFYSEQEDSKMIKNILHLGADVNTKDNEGKTALDYVPKKSYKDNTEIRKILIEAGAIDNAQADAVKE